MSRWMRYSRQVDWPMRARLVVGCTVLSGLWLYALTHDPGAAGVFYALMLFGTLGTLAVGWGETQRFMSDCDFTTPRRTLREMWAEHVNEIREAPLTLVATFFYVVAVCIATALFMVVVVFVGVATMMILREMFTL